MTTVDGGHTADCDVTVIATPILVTGVFLNYDSTQLTVGYDLQLVATILPVNATNKDVTWESSNESLATVSADGLVTAVAIGNVVVTVTTEDGGFEDTCAIQVLAYHPVTDVTLDKHTLDLEIGEGEDLDALFTPSYATNRNVTWESDDESVATVSATGWVEGVGAGTAQITVTTEEGGFTDTCDVTVSAVAGNNTTFSADGVSFDLVYVPGKTFPTGTNDAGGAETVAADFWIGETEVTYALWSKVYTWATANGYQFPVTGEQGGGTGTKSSSHPATNMKWSGAMVWCNAATEWYNAQTGTSFTCVYTYSGQTIRDGTITNRTAYENAVAETSATGFRLPTSNEWELAARWRGSDSTNTVSGYTDPYFTKGNSASHAYTAWSDTSDTNPANGVEDNKDANDLVAVYGDYYTPSWVPTGVAGTAAVKSKQPNTLGLYDMSGNVNEYCFDYYGSSRIKRGGSWAEQGYTLGIGQIGTTSAGNDYEGFRLARNY